MGRRGESWDSFYKRYKHSLPLRQRIKIWRLSRKFARENRRLNRTVGDEITDAHIEDLRRRGATRIAQRLEKARDREKTRWRYCQEHVEWHRGHQWTVECRRGRPWAN